MKQIILKLCGFYGEPDFRKKMEATPQPISVSFVPKSYLKKYPCNDLDKINKNYQII